MSLPFCEQAVALNFNLRSADLDFIDCRLVHCLSCVVGPVLTLGYQPCV